MPNPMEHLMLTSIAKSAEEPNLKNDRQRSIMTDELTRELIRRRTPAPLPVFSFTPPVNKLQD
jgi:hypothetical protein